MNDRLKIATALATATTSDELITRLMRCAESVGASEVNNKFERSVNQGGIPGGYNAWSLDRKRTSSMEADARLRKSRDADPCLQHLKRHSTPIFWDRALYESAQQGYEWQVFASAGMHWGVGVCLHLAAERHYALGLMWDGSKPSDPRKRTDIAAALQIFAVFAEPSAFRLASATTLPSEEPTLTTREQQCLFWASRGITDEDTASIVGISHRAVGKHIDSSIRKLGGRNLTHAAVIATKQGLLASDLPFF